MLRTADCTEREGRAGAMELRAAHLGCFGEKELLYWAPQHLAQGAADSSGSTRVLVSKHSGLPCPQTQAVGDVPLPELA